MEVHAHSHTERKKFTHYLWEFLMLFLAVFCGFLAENLREHIIEHKRARAYAESFYQIVLAPVYRDFLTFVSMDDLTAGKRSSYIDSLRNTELPLANKDPELLNSLVNALMATKSTRKILQTRFYPKAIKEATEIMEMLKKEYNIQ